MNYYRKINKEPIILLTLNDDTIVPINDENELKSICNIEDETYQFSLHGNTFLKSNIIDINFTNNYDLDYLPEWFGCNFINLQTINEFPDSIETINIGCLKKCHKLNSEIIFPKNLKSIGNYFLDQSDNFNNIIRFTKSTELTTIGDGFLSNTKTFNKPIGLPNSVTEIGSWFIYNMSSFNSTISIPTNLTSLGSFFISDCLKFNKPIDLSKTKLTRINSWTIANLNSFNSTIRLPTSLTYIDNDVIYKLPVWNQSFTFYPTKTCSVPYNNNFIANCDKFVGPFYLNANLVNGFGTRSGYVSRSLYGINSNTTSYSNGILCRVSSGSSFNELHKKLPDTNQSNFYRKLI